MKRVRRRETKVRAGEGYNSARTGNGEQRRRGAGAAEGQHININIEIEGKLKSREQERVFLCETKKARAKRDQSLSFVESDQVMMSAG